MTKTHTLSPQQMDVCNFVEYGEGSVVVEAVAGAGKTTTLIEALRRTRGNVFFGAFNRKIANEIKTKAEKAGLLRKGLFISTMHGAGYSAWKRYAPDVVVDENKVRNLVAKAVEQQPDYEAYSTFAVKAVSFAKQLLLPTEADTPAARQQWMDMVDRFSLDEELPEGTDTEVEQALRLALWAFNTSVKLNKTQIDFDDMIHAPLHANLRLFGNDFVFLDEAQDTNPARRLLARRMLKPRGRLIAVGDSKQAIYGFTGADSDALALIQQEFNACRLPLTVTYRCPKAVVQHAHQWVSHIQAHESAPDGVVRAIPGRTQDGKAWFVAEQPTREDAVLCRYTKPLIETAYAMLREGIACRVEGRDIGKGLIALARRWKVKTLDALEARLDKYLERERAKAAAKNNPKRAEAAEDKVTTLLVFIERCRAKGNNTVACVVAEIEAMFGDDVTDVLVLSTIHKAKGREWPTVFWLVTEGGRPARHAWEEESELCCNYVATTRAQRELVLINQ